MTKEIELVNKIRGGLSLGNTVWTHPLLSLEQAAALLAAWRDECVRDACDRCSLLSRAPRAESDTSLKDALKLYNDEVVARMAAEAELDRLREVHHRGCDCAVDQACAFVAERDRIKDALTESLMASAGRADELVRLREQLAAAIVINGEIAELREENEALRSLVDGAEEVVELFGARAGYVGQKRWAAGWLDKARALLRAKGETK